MQVHELSIPVDYQIYYYYFTVILTINLSVLTINVF